MKYEMNLQRRVLIRNMVCNIIGCFRSRCIETGIFLIFAAFINCKVFVNAAQPCEFTGFPFIAVSGSQRFIKRILCDFFRQGLIFDDCHHVRVNLQVIGIVQFFIIQNRSPPFYTD